MDMQDMGADDNGKNKPSHLGITDLKEGAKRCSTFCGVKYIRLKKVETV